MLRKFSILVLLLSLILGGSVYAQMQPIPLPDGRALSLFSPASEAQIRALASRPEQIGTERSTYVTLNPQALNRANNSRHPGRVVDDPGIVLNLFDDVTYTAVNSRLEPRQLNRPGYVWYGNIPDVEFSNVVMVVGDDGHLAMQVLIPGKNYYIDSAGNGVYRISQINTYEQRGYDDYVIVTPTEAEQAAVQANLNSPRADDGSLIDVMVVYTPKAVTFLGGEANMEFAIENVIALSNLTYQNSSVNFQLRLVHTELVNYVESPFVDLSRLTNPSDGVMDNVHTLRNTYKADLVALIPGTSAEDRGYCGIANLPTSLPAPTTGFSVTEALCISDITFPHELGHNMGKAHDPANAGGAVHPYAYGYQDKANPPGQDWGDFVTLMAYSDGGECPPVYQPGVCPAIAWWSSPDQTHNGKPLGTAGQNNALSLNQTALQIANYRISDDGGSSTPTPTPTTFPEITPTATATETAPDDLIINGGFEIDADSDRIPDGWSSLRPKAQKCGDAGLNSDCAVKIKGKPAVKNKIQQNITTDLPLSGTTVKLTAQFKGKNVIAGGTLQAVVKYLDSDSKDVLSIDLPVGTYAYTPLEDTLTIGGSIKKIKVRLRYNAASGKIIVDNVSLQPVPGF